MAKRWMSLVVLGIGATASGQAPDGAASIAEKILSLRGQAVKSEHYARTTAFLKSLGPESAGAFDSVAPLLEHEESPVRADAAMVLGRIGPPARATLALVRTVDDPAQQRDVVQAAIRGLGHLGPDAREAVPALIALARKQPSLVLESWASPIAAVARIEAEPRSLLAGAFVKAEGPVTADELIVPSRVAALLKGEDAPLTPRLAAALGQGGDEAEVVKFLSSWALGRIGPRAAAAAPALAAVAAEEGSAPVQVAALAALLRVAPDGDLAARTVRERLAADDPFVRTTAAYCLGILGPSAAKAAPALRAAAEDPAPAVRAWAARSLGRIVP